MLGGSLLFYYVSCSVSRCVASEWFRTRNTEGAFEDEEIEGEGIMSRGRFLEVGCEKIRNTAVAYNAMTEFEEVVSVVLNSSMRGYAEFSDDACSQPPAFKEK